MVGGRKGSTKAERVFPGTATQWEWLTAGMGSSRSEVSKIVGAYNLGKRFQAAMQSTGVRQPLASHKARERGLYPRSNTRLRGPPDRRQRPHSSGRRESGTPIP